MKNNKGFTLIELTIAISLIGVVLLITTNLLNYNIAKYNDINNYYRYKIDARYAMDKITNEIKKNYDTSFEGGRVKSGDSSILVNSVPNEAKGNICFSYDVNRYGIGDGYGELRGANGETIVKNIKEFRIESEDTSILKVTIKTGRQNNKGIFELVKYIRLYS